MSAYPHSSSLIGASPVAAVAAPGRLSGPGPVALNLPGTAGPDTLEGSDQVDTLRGAGGNDVLKGYGGDDTLYGDAGDDTVYGGAGSDRLEGGAGADILDGEEGADTLLGGDGNDNLYDSRGDNLLRGGDGDDRLETASNGRNQLFGEAGDDILTSSRGSGLLDGGAGNDQLFISGYWSADGPQSIEVRGGDGDDTIITALGAAATTIVASGGAGSDTFIAQTRSPSGTVAVTDFTAGAGGDLIDISRVALATSGNPFAANGSVRLLQRGADTVVQARAGTLDTTPFEDVLVLRNIAKGALTPLNFANGFNPDGSSSGLALTGGAGADRSAGSWLNDTLDGGAGNDILYGSMGNDRLTGGDGDDQLDGDRTDVRPGSYTPWAAERSGDDVLDGGAGNDTLTSAWGNDTLRGGAGNDRLVLSPQGAITPGQPVGYAVTLDGGDGNDRFEVLKGGMPAPDVSMTGGAGSDTFAFNAPPQLGVWTITDFQAGPGGDVLDIFEALGWTRESPFAAGYFRLAQRGADTVVQYDGDGINPASGFADLVVLKNLNAASLTAENMRYGHMPGNAAAALGPLVAGSANADRLQGNALANQLDGGAGNDALTGEGGNDLLQGGAGTDAALFSGNRDQYALQLLGNGRLVVADLRGGAHDGKDSLVDVERMVFADAALALDTGFDDVAGQAYRIYRAAFDRAPDQAGLGFWIAAMDGGMGLAEIAGGFVRSKEFASLYGAAPTNAEIVTRMYYNILDRAPEQGGYDYWLAALDNRVVELPAMLALFSESNENRTAVAELIAAGVAFDPYGG